MRSHRYNNFPGSNAVGTCCFVLSATLWCVLQTPVTGWLEAFAAHPRIGDMEELRARFSASAAMSKEEQATAAAETDDEVLRVRVLASLKRPRLAAAFTTEA